MQIIINALRVRPRSFSVLTEPSQHQSDGCPLQEGACVSVETFPIFAQPSAAVEPSDGALHDPPLGQDHEFAGVASPDDFDVHCAADPCKSVLELRTLVARVGIEL